MDAIESYATKAIKPREVSELLLSKATLSIFF